mmetsp:Transcript_35437/g.88412  ORF Transcript_35437/g.88412 Transcript_35437/m.88412 type:complete len:326 (+) Transcript_35437:293-1270(+)
MLRVSVEPLAVQLDNALLRCVAELAWKAKADLLPSPAARAPGEALGEPGAALGEPEALREAQRAVATVLEPRVLLEFLSISEVELLLTARAALASLHAGTHRAPLRFGEIAAVGVLHNPRHLALGLAASYVADGVLSAPMVIGSLELLGNPAWLLTSLLRGMGDLVRLPLAGLRRSGPLGLIGGLQNGVLSLLRNGADGALTSVHSLSSGVARNLSVSQRREPASLVDGVLALGNGVLGGVTGLIADPVRGAARGGLVGLLKGVGTGAIGVVTKPTGGALRLVSAASLGLLRAISTQQPSAQPAPLGGRGSDGEDEEDDGQEDPS